MIELKPLADTRSQLKRLMETAFQDYEKWSASDVSRLQSIRASSLPFCPSAYLYKIGMFGIKGRVDARSSFYFSVGHVVHDWIQDVLGSTGHVVGDWYNVRTQEYRAFSVHPNPGNHDWKYRELTLSTTKLVGHCDAVIALDPKLAAKASKAKTEKKRKLRFKKLKVRLFVGDYKTCTVAAATQKAKNPGQVYEEQLCAYSLALTEMGMTVSAWGNIFIPRDNPFKYTLASNEWTPDLQITMKEKLRSYNKNFRKTLVAETWKDFQKLLRIGRCPSPFCTVCTAKDPKFLLRQAFRRGVKEGRWPASNVVGIPVKS